MSRKTVRRSIGMTQEMRDRLAQLVSKQPRNTTEADLIREAIRLYLDDQEDLIGSRKHFHKSLQIRIDKLEHALSFHLNILLYLILMQKPLHEEQRLTKAILSVERDHEYVMSQIKAVRDLK